MRRWEQGYFEPVNARHRHERGGQMARSVFAQEVKWAEGIPDYVGQKSGGAREADQFKCLAASVLLMAIKDVALDWICDDSGIDVPCSFRFWCYAAGRTTNEQVKQARIGIIQHWLDHEQITLELADLLIAALLSHGADRLPPTSPAVQYWHQSTPA